METLKDTAAWGHGPGDGYSTALNSRPLLDRTHGNRPLIADLSMPYSTPSRVHRASSVLTRLPDGSTAIVVSLGNAGLVLERGIELGFAAWLTREIQLSGSYAYYDFDIEEQQQGDVLQSNTPRHKGPLLP